MTLSHNADETVPEQRLRSQFRPGCLAHDARFKINNSVAKRPAVFIGFRHKPKAHAGRFGADALNEFRSKVLNEAVASSQRESADEPFQVQLLGWT
jgi:hypothetical protein